MTDPSRGNAIGAKAPMPVHPITTVDAKRHQSRSGYWFDEDEANWELDKNTTINVEKVGNLLDVELKVGYTSTLAHYARTMSSAHTNNINSSMFSLLRDTRASTINPTMLINYRATLTRETEHYLGTPRGFLYKWHDLGYPGISDEVVDLLDSWTLKGNIKGDAVKRLDPTEGPLTDNELLAFNEGAARAFEQGLISITDLSIALLTSHTGRRPVQIAHTKIRDLDGTQKNKKGEAMYLISIPRAKQRGEVFRDSFKAFAMTEELWVVLDAQRKHSISSVERKLKYELQEQDSLDLPLFPDIAAFDDITSIIQLRPLLQTDCLHLAAKHVTATLKRVVSSAECHSERTGDILDVVAKRFRYTVGTRAAREGFGMMVIAELLDHTDTQNAGVYIKNIPDHVAALDEALGYQLAPYAQAFQGVLVDREEDAQRGNDPASRIRHKGGDNTGTCGMYGFCGANVPIPCYTCMHFQPWLDGPHHIIYAELIAERERILALTGDLEVAAVNDRTFLAVAQVIQQCQARNEELARKVEK